MSIRPFHDFNAVNLDLVLSRVLDETFEPFPVLAHFECSLLVGRPECALTDTFIVLWDIVERLARGRVDGAPFKTPVGNLPSPMLVGPYVSNIFESILEDLVQIFIG